MTQIKFRVPQVGVLADLCGDTVQSLNAQVSHYRDLWHPMLKVNSHREVQ